jgi:hypothetical protein
VFKDCGKRKGLDMPSLYVYTRDTYTPKEEVP